MSRTIQFSKIGATTKIKITESNGAVTNHYLNGNYNLTYNGNAIIVDSFQPSISFLLSEVFPTTALSSEAYIDSLATALMFTDQKT